MCGSVLLVGGGWSFAETTKPTNPIINGLEMIFCRSAKRVRCLISQPPSAGLLQQVLKTPISQRQEPGRPTTSRSSPTPRSGRNIQAIGRALGEVAPPRGFRPRPGAASAPGRGGARDRPARLDPHAGGRLARVRSRGSLPSEKQTTDIPRQPASLVSPYHPLRCAFRSCRAPSARSNACGACRQARDSSMHP